MNSHEHQARPATVPDAGRPGTPGDPRAFDELVQHLRDDAGWRRRIRAIRVRAVLARAGWSVWAGMGRLGSCFGFAPCVPSARSTSGRP